MRLEGLDEQGLGPTDQAYLRALADGATRLNVVASLLGLPSRTVAEVTEPFLLRTGFIVKDDQGRRQLTAAGRDHLSMKATQSRSFRIRKLPDDRPTIPGERRRDGPSVRAVARAILPTCRHHFFQRLFTT